MYWSPVSYSTLLVLLSLYKLQQPLWRARKKCSRQQLRWVVEATVPRCHPFEMCSVVLYTSSKASSCFMVQVAKQTFLKCRFPSIVRVGVGVQFIQTKWRERQTVTGGCWVFSIFQDIEAVEYFYLKVDDSIVMSIKCSKDAMGVRWHIWKEIKIVIKFLNKSRQWILDELYRHKGKSGYKCAWKWPRSPFQLGIP